MKGKKIASKVLYLFLLVLTFSYSFSLGFIYERSTTYEVESNNFKYSMLSTSVKDVVEPSGNNLQLINVKTEIEEPEEIPEVKKAPINDKEDPQKKKGGTGKKVTAKEAVGMYETSGKSVGIDVSKWNGNIDWKKVKDSGIDFAMIRVGYRGQSSGEVLMDPYFQQNVENATKAGVKVGVYFFSVAINEKEALEEAAWTVSVIKKYSITYPVAYDFETFGKYRAKNLTNDDRTKNAIKFLNYIKSKGYTPMMYASKNAFMNNFNTSRLSGYKMWLAHYITATDYTGTYHMWQYTDSGSVPGVSGNVDMNVAKFKYTANVNAKAPTTDTSEDEKLLKTLSFTSCDEEVTTTTAVKYRSSPTTNLPNLLGQFQKNVKLKRTGVTKTKVDGYYWSRVIYNNQVVYVASNYLKLVEKPTESSEEKTPEIDPDKPTVPENPDETLSGEKDGTDQSGNSNDEA